LTAGTLEVEKEAKSAFNLAVSLTRESKLVPTLEQQRNTNNCKLMMDL
jgi:hypothetical protein